jgi:4-amino-4-deoxy-L-arabinose transferase-like glycosyltransferase
MKPLYWMILGFIVCAYVGLVRLHHTYFWDDEAHVGIIAKNFLATGQLTGWDGRHLFAFRNGALLDSNLRTINPPLEYVATAAAFWLFGPSTWAGRLPFVIAGLLSLLVFARLLFDVVGKDWRYWGYAVGGLAFSMPFLLNIRQCRYYALSLLFSLLTYHSYRWCLRTKQWRDFVALAVWASLAFYSNHLLGVAFFLALLCTHGVFHRQHWAGQDWRRVIVTVAVFSIATMPYAVYYQIWQRPDIPAMELWYLRKAKLLWWNLRELNLIGYFPWVAAVGVGLFLIRNATQQTPVSRTMREWLVLGLGYVGFLALLSPQPTETPTIADVRYLMPALPFVTGIIGLLLATLHEKMPMAALTLFVVNLTTNVCTLTPSSTEFRWLLPAYLKEVHQDYPTSYSAVSQFLQRHAGQDELVYAYPPHANYPLIFYGGDRLKFCCLLTNHTQLPRHAVADLPAPLFIEQHIPDWFIAFGSHAAVPHLLAFFQQHSTNTRDDRQGARFHLVEVLNVYWRDTQRPELPWHSFGPRTDFDRRSEAVYVFKRIDTRDLAHGMIPAAKSAEPQ